MSCSLTSVKNLIVNVFVAQMDQIATFEIFIPDSFVLLLS